MHHLGTRNIGSFLKKLPHLSHFLIMTPTWTSLIFLSRSWVMSTLMVLLPPFYCWGLDKIMRVDIISYIYVNCNINGEILYISVVDSIAVHGEQCSPLRSIASPHNLVAERIGCRTRTYDPSIHCYSFRGLLLATKAKQLKLEPSLHRPLDALRFHAVNNLGC